jgi:peptidoglycan/LPS O-acetylase OafA/YrhL
MMDTTIPVWNTAHGIRGFACLIVLIGHAFLLFSEGAAPYMVGIGKIGVWLFFVLSAFLLTHKFHYTGFGLRALQYYACARFIRIIPLFVITVCCYHALNMPDMQTWDDVFRILLFQKGAGHLWTIPVECTFYALLPLIAWGLGTIQKHYGCGVMMLCWVASIVLHQYFMPFWNTPANTITTLWYVPCFMCGILCALLHERFVWIHRHGDWISLCLMGLILCFSPLLGHGWLPKSVVALFSTYHLPIGLIWSVVIVSALHGSGVLPRILCWRGLRYLGTWSYPIYLIHWIVYLKLVARYPHDALAMICALIISIMMGAMIHYTIELPIEQWRRHRLS